jgi:hypothetical protein
MFRARQPRGAVIHPGALATRRKDVSVQLTVTAGCFPQTDTGADSRGAATGFTGILDIALPRSLCGSEQYGTRATGPSRPGVRTGIRR